MNIKTIPVVTSSLRDSPSLIERVFPSMKVSEEAQKERKAGPGQTLTGLGSYWKGRKPLILVRACILGCLLPATQDPEKDLQVFELLMAMDDESVQLRQKKRQHTISGNTPYRDAISNAFRLEEMDVDPVGERWSMVNQHLGTNAKSVQDLVHQLGVMRFGGSPRVADTFAGGGSIPFEAGRSVATCMPQTSTDRLYVDLGRTEPNRQCSDNKDDLLSAQAAKVKDLNDFVEKLGVERDSRAT